MKKLYASKADYLATAFYNKEFHDLPQNIQDAIYDKAIRDVNDRWDDLLKKDLNEIVKELVDDEADNLRKASKEGL